MAVSIRRNQDELPKLTFLPNYSVGSARREAQVGGGMDSATQPVPGFSPGVAFEKAVKDPKMPGYVIVHQKPRYHSSPGSCASRYSSVPLISGRGQHPVLPAAPVGCRERFAPRSDDESPSPGLHAP